MRAAFSRWNRTNQTHTSYASAITLQKLARVVDENALKRYVMRMNSDLQNDLYGPLLGKFVYVKL